MKCNGAFNWRIILCVLFVLSNRFYTFAQNGKVSLQLEHTVGNLTLALDSLFQNSLGEPFSVRKFRYYISNIRFVHADNKKSYLVKNRYFLVDETNPVSKIITVSIPPGKYSSVSFLLGVDSLKNVSGAQTGALDPLNDMFWTWKSGYVMAKMEGRSPVSNLPHKMFEYHIGGYKGAHNVLQRAELRLPEILNILPGTVASINIQADVNAWFNAVHSLAIAQYPACTSEGALSRQYAENYIRMFHIQNLSLQ
ncbi:MAG: hypothetical protein KF746_21120 [Chitinophagaceae bacterium]|nr:hypothetical protein [Chitinophagaceae bacterium]